MRRIEKKTAICIKNLPFVRRRMGLDLEEMEWKERSGSRRVVDDTCCTKDPGLQQV